MPPHHLIGAVDQNLFDSPKLDLAFSWKLPVPSANCTDGIIKPRCVFTCVPPLEESMYEESSATHIYD